MEVDYSNYSDMELLELWKTRWSGSQTAFCRNFDINQGNFNKYIKGKRISKQSRDAIIKYLQEQHNEDQSVVWNSVVECISYVPDINTNIILFIDGDNSSYTLAHLKEYIPAHTHIFFFYLKGRYSRYASGLGQKSEFTFVHSISHIKDSVDMAITLLSTHINTAICQRIQYVFVSKDHFIQDLVIYFSRFRECKAITSQEEFLSYLNTACM